MIVLKTEWDLAKRDLDRLSEPYNARFNRKSFYIPSMHGYECSVHINQKTCQVIQVVIWNDETNQCYAKYFNQPTEPVTSSKRFK